jgi:hypothetical protein
MDAQTVLRKTNKGRDEIEHRRHRLPLRVRRALILVDGKASLAQLLHNGSFLPGFYDDLMSLLEQGFVAIDGDGMEASWLATPIASGHGAEVAATTEEVTTLSISRKQRLIGLARIELGNEATKIIQRIDESADSDAALVATLERCHKLIKLIIDEEKADEFLRLGRELLVRSL